MNDSSTGEILAGLWQFAALHPEWTEDEGGEDGWEQSVAWWAVATEPGLVLIDPLVDDWHELDDLVARHRRCAGVVRTCHWHERSVVEAAARYDARIWAKPHVDGAARYPVDEAIADGDELFAALRAFEMDRTDEIALWLGDHAALVFADVMLRSRTGELCMCPPSWTQPTGGRERLTVLLGGLTELPVHHVLVSHGPLVLGDGGPALRAAIG